MTFEMDAKDVPVVTEEMRQRDDFNNRKARQHRKTHSVGSPKAMARKLRNQRGWEMRAEGATWHAIAEELGFKSYKSAYDAIMTYVGKKGHDSAELFRQNEGARLETAIEVVMGIITGKDEVYGLEEIANLDGVEQEMALAKLADRIKKDAELKLKAVDRLVNVGGRMGKVFGYDAPTKVENSGTTGTITVEFNGAMAKPAKMNEPELIVEPQK